MARAAEGNIELLIFLGIGGYLAWPYIKGFVAPDAAAATPEPFAPLVRGKAVVPPAKKAPVAPATAGKLVLKTVSGQPRGIRNNNPGNIRMSGNAWRGKIGNDGAFEIFDTPTNGIRAMMVNLRTYFNNYGLNTVAGIAGRWAPPSENKTAGYITVVNKQGGLATGAVLNLNDQATMFKLVRGIIGAENGSSFTNYYPDSMLQQAWNAM